MWQRCATPLFNYLCVDLIFSYKLFTISVFAIPDIDLNDMSLYNDIEDKTIQGGLTV